MLEFYEEAVRIAIQGKKFEIAQEYALMPQDEKMKKKLWEEIAKESMSQKNRGESTGLEIIKKSKGNLSLSDVLRYISPKVKLKVFKDDIIDQLQDYGGKIDELRKQMNEYNKTSEQIGEEIKELGSVPLPISPDKFCDRCEKILLGSEKFYIFPCRHGFHRVKDLFIYSHW
jgi:hypothetical protein